jgi:hypothetical protein
MNKQDNMLIFKPGPHTLIQHMPLTRVPPDPRHVQGHRQSARHGVQHARQQHAAGAAAAGAIASVTVRLQNAARELA